MRTTGTRLRAALAAAALLAPLGWLGSGPPAASAADAVDADARRLLKRPALTRPIVGTVTPSTPHVVLNPRRDYVIRIAANAVFTRGLIIQGGRNVVLEPGTLRYAPPRGASPLWRTRGLYLKGQTGIAYVSGLRIRGPLQEGINLDQRAPGAAVVLRDIEIDPVIGSESGHHADLLQTWAGPAKLVVDGFRGTSNYQGFFLRPNQMWRSGPKPKYFWLRGVELNLRTGAYALWADGRNAYPISVQSVAVDVNPLRMSRDRWLWPKPSTGDRTWSRVVGR